jgi:copper chaperone CopZ
MKTKLNVKMHCKGCERTITNALMKLKGIEAVNADYTNEKVTVKYNENLVNIKDIIREIEEAGYEAKISEEGGSDKKERKKFLGIFNF